MQDVTSRFVRYDPEFLEGAVIFMIGGAEFALPGKTAAEYFKNVKYYQMESVADIVENYDQLSETRRIPGAMLDWQSEMRAKASYMRYKDAERHQDPEPRKFAVIHPESFHYLVDHVVSRKRKIMESLTGIPFTQMNQFNHGLLDHVNLTNFKRIDGYNYNPGEFSSFEAYEFDITDVHGDCIDALFFVNFYPHSDRDAAAEHELRTALASSPLDTFDIVFDALDQNYTWQSIDGPVRRGMKLNVQSIHGSKWDKDERPDPESEPGIELVEQHRRLTLERLIGAGV